MRKKVLLIFSTLVILFLTSLGTASASQNPEINRLAGYDKYETASLIAKTGWQQSDYAVLAYGENYPDALAAVPLAKKLNAPLLLTNQDSLNPKTNAALQDLQVKTVCIIGGIGVISANIENELVTDGYSVIRYAGKDKYDTAIKIAEELGDITEIAITTGEDYADALSIGPIAAARHMPIILVPKNDITKSIQNYIKSKSIAKTYIVGDQSLISNKVANKFKNPERILGKDKYTRNIAILNRFMDSYQYDNICLATGENFADALAGAVYAAQNKGAVALIKEDLPTTNKFLKANMASSAKITVFGGESVVPSTLIQAIFNFNSVENLDYGSVDTQTYTDIYTKEIVETRTYINKYFDLTIDIPKGWIVADNVKLSQDVSNFDVVELLSLHNIKKKYDQEFKMVATKTNSNFRNIDDYLTFYKKGLDNTPLILASQKEYTKKIGGVDFKVLELKFPNSTAVRKIYATVLNGYALSFTISSPSEASSSDLNHILSSIKFN